MTTHPAPELTPPMTEVSEEAERAKFIAENDGDFDFTLNDAGQFADVETYLVFAGWYARAEAIQVEITGLRNQHPPLATANGFSG